MRAIQGTWLYSGRLAIWHESEDSPNRPELLDQDLTALECEADSFQELQVYYPTIIPSTILTDNENSQQPNRRRLSPHFFSQQNSEDSHKLLPYQVRAAVFDPLPGLLFLTSLGEIEPPCAIDQSLLYWAEVSKFLLEALAQGRFLPALVSHGTSYQSRWIVAPDGPGQEKLSLLARTMPPICRGVSELAEVREHQLAGNYRLSSVTTTTPGALLESFLSHATNQLIRYFLARFEGAQLLPSSTRTTRQSTVVAWLQSLTNCEQNSLDGNSFEVMQLEQRLKRWNLTHVEHVAQGTSTAFRLHPPEHEAHDKWRLEFLLIPRVQPHARSVSETTTSATAAGSAQSPLQSARPLQSSLEPLSHPVRDLWQGDFGFFRFSDSTLQDVEEQLLRDLGTCSVLVPAVRTVLLETAFPSEVELTTQEAYDFLRTAVPILERQGISVFVPKWWDSRRNQLGVHVSLTPSTVGRTRASTSVVGAQELVDFSWELSLGGEPISEDEFRTLVSGSTPLIKIKNEWIELQPEQVKLALRALERKSQKQLPLLDALRMGLGVESDIEGIPIASFSAEGWVRSLIEGITSARGSIVQPSSFQGELRPYQLAGLDWLSFLSKLNLGGCLADDMGLGKTIQFLALLLSEKDRRAEGVIEPTLLVVPMSILDNWHREAKRFAPSLSVYVHHGQQRLTGDLFLERAAKTDLVLTTYSLTHRDAHLIREVSWGRITLDEAQNIKNPATKQTRAIRNMVHQLLVDSSREQPIQRLALTGTPLENHLDELWSIFDVLNPGYLGTQREFRSRFAAPIEKYRDGEAAEKLTQLIRPFVLRRLKTDRAIIDDLPEKIEMDEFVHLTQEQAALYQSVLENMLEEVDRSTGIRRKGIVLAAITRLKQICDHPALASSNSTLTAERSGKLIRLAELLEVILSEGDKTLIFTQFAQMGALLQQFLHERFKQPVLFLHGALTKKARSAIVDTFQADGGPAIFVLSLKVGGVGLNLTAANQIVHYDQWWNPAVQDQATDRAFRIGQKRNVQVRKLISQGTLEERINSMLAQKRELAASVVGETREAITQLSTDELRELLTLTSEPIIDTNEEF